MIILFLLGACNPKLGNGLRRNDLRRDVEMITDKGTLIIRLSDSTPLHRNNFLKLVKEHFYDSISFHRVISQFMVQAGDPDTKHFLPGQRAGNKMDIPKIPAEFRSSLFHKKGVIAAARMGDEVNPQKASSGSQFYLVQGKVFTEQSLDAEEIGKMKGRKIPEEYRAVYKTIGGTPHLDQQYTVFGEVIKGVDVIDSIAIVPTTGREGGDRPITEVRILKAKLVRRE